MDSNASNNDEPKKWERPWTVEELRRNSANWSLAGDSGLLNHIEDFSKRLLGRVHDTNTLMDDLMHESKLASVRVDDAFNDFVMLANTQFVENRVFDDDVTQQPEEEKKPEVEKSRDQREADLVTRVKEAIQHGLAVVDDMFEVVHVDIGADSDSEEELPGESILKVKNPYVERPLPHLFGTQAFMNDDFIGLKEESSSEESEEEEESESESDESEKKSDSDDFSDDFSDEKREIIPGKKTQKRPPSSSESDGDLFGDKGDLFDDRSEQSDDNNTNDIPTTGAEHKKPAGGFASELAKRIGAAPPGGVGENDESEEDWDEQPEHKTREAKASKPRASSQSHHQESKTKHKETKTKTAKKNVEDDEDDLFPPEDDGETSWVAGGGGLFSGGGLFDEPGGGLFDDITDDSTREEKTVEKAAPKVSKKSQPSPTGKHKPPGGVSIFGPGDGDLFGESPPEAPPIKTPPTKKAAPPTIGADLFADEDDSEDDLFAVKPKAKVETKPKAPPTVDLFADEADGKGDLFAATKAKPIPSSAEKKKPSLAGAVPMFGGGVNPLTLSVGSRRPKSEDEASDDNRSTTSSRTSSRLTAGGGKREERSSSVSSNSNSLFADEPEEPPSSNKKISKPSVAAIFDDVDDDDGNDLFSSAPEPSSQSRKPRATSLFIEDEDEDDLFAATKAKPKLETKPKAATKPLFSPVEGGSDLFAGVQKEKTTQPKAEPAKKKVAISLFDEDDEEDEAGSDLFSPGTKSVRDNEPSASSQVSSKAATKPRKSLFADDDVLFGSADDDPNIDLFGPTSPLTPKQPTFPAPVSEAASAPSLTVVPPSKPPTSFPLDGATVTESDDVTPVNAPPDVVDATKEKIKMVASPSRSRPVGGVTLFGGVDIMTIKAKRSSMFHEDETPETSSNHVDTGHVDTGHVDTSHVDIAQHVLSRVAKASAEESPASFEDGFVETLTSLNKNRAKIGAKRRPPTRRGRRDPDEIASPEHTIVAPQRPTLLEVSGATVKTTAAGVSAPANEPRVPPIDANDSSPDELFRTPKTEARSRRSEDVPDFQRSNITNGGSASSAFSKPTTTTTTTTTTTNTSKTDTSLNNAPESPDDLFAKKPAKKQHSVDLFGSPADVDHEDIFSSRPRPSRALNLDQDTEVFGGLDGAKEVKKSKLSETNVFDDSPSDIFNSPKLKPPPGGSEEIFSTPSGKISSRTAGKGEGGSDEDIFKNEATKTGNKTSDPFEEDEEIFVTPARTPAPPAVTSRTGGADDIFKDDTDIFADIPKKTRKSKKDGSLFNDDVDDIFATPSAKTPNKNKSTPTNTKKTKTKKKAKQTSQQAAASIFDENAPNIFDDPLSALQS